MTSFGGADVRENQGSFDVSANTIGVFSIRCSLKLFIYLFIYFISFLYFLTKPSSAGQYKTHAFYTNRSRLILLRQISNDNFLKAPLKSTIFKNEQREHI